MVAHSTPRGLERDSVVNLDRIDTLAVDELGPKVGTLRHDQEAGLAAAAFHAFGLEW